MTKRPVTIEDLLRLQTISTAVLSPDGQFLAFVVRRPSITAKTHMRHHLSGNHRADIWIASIETGEPRNITNGDLDDTGYWHPLWSPDSRRLAVLSTKGGNVTLWVWERTWKDLRQVTKRGVHIKDGDVPVSWISHNQLVCSILPEGEKPASLDIETRSAEIAMREWPKAWKGEEATASVLESNRSIPMSGRPQGQLLHINTETGEQRIITEGDIRFLRASPDRKYFTFLRRVEVVLPDPNVPIRYVPGSPEGFTLGIANAYGKILLDCHDQIRDPAADSIQWSMGGKELALIARQPSSDEPLTFRIKPVDGTVQGVIHNELRPMAVTWSCSDHLLVLAKSRNGDGNEKNHRVDWWSINTNAYHRNVTEGMQFVPQKLFPHKETQSLIGLADGALWRIQPETSDASSIWGSSKSRIDSIIWTDLDVSIHQASQASMEFIVKLSNEETSGLYHVKLSPDSNTDHVAPIEKPAQDVSLVEASSITKSIVFRANESTGSYLWLSRFPNDNKHTKVFETNTFLKDIAQGQIRKIEYRSIDGQGLKGWVILPVDYEEGNTYPLVTRAYAGRVYGNTPPAVAASMYPDPSLNLQLLAAKGYAVLIPSMPFGPKGQVSDPLMKLADGVIPAIDKLIDMGIADANRLGLIGRSYGGYSTYGLVAQTNRFRAAIALGGASDLISRYGTFDARRRYDAYPHEQNPSLVILETGQGRMRHPPWKDPNRYIRNSPLFYVENVTTPLMIIQGDMDHVALQQGEEFFTALYRQNKRARFVRYWGEGHIIQSPANIRDMWEQIFDWFDHYLC